METAIRSVMNTMFQEYAFGLDKADTSQFPLVLRDLQLKPAKVNEDLEDTPFILDSGKIDYVKINPGWTGSVELDISGIHLNLSFSPMKAAKLAMKPSEPEYNTEEIFMTGAYAPKPAPPDPNVPPRFCKKHDSTEKRVKGEAREWSCKTCGITFMSTYAEVTFCSGCSERQKQCLICGGDAPNASNYIPGDGINNGNRAVGPPGRQASTEQRPAQPPGSGRRQDQYPNLQPTDSIPVSQGKDNKATPSSVVMPPGQRAPPRQQAPVGNRPPAPSTQQVFTKQQRPPRPQQEDDDDENPLVLWLRKLSCGAGPGGFFQEEDEPIDTRAQLRRPPPRGPPPRQAR